MIQDRKIHGELLTDFEMLGEGARLTLKFTVYRVKKTKTAERIAITMAMTRHTIDRLLSQVHKMHARDRTRLKRETERIEDEIATLTRGDGE